jgi:hypothetical protein
MRPVASPREVWEYLRILEKNRFLPNFWCSGDYFAAAEWVVVENDGFFEVHDDEGVIVLPPLNREGEVGPFSFCWSGFSNLSLNVTSQFLDWEYIYNPANFLAMVGGKWQVFRKNIRKFPDRAGESLLYVKPSSLSILFTPLVAWLEDHKGSELFDPETIIRYIEQGLGSYKVLVGKDTGNVYGVNIWDENYLYINFRYSFCSPRLFISEYLRWRFYTDEEILFSGKMVNDGGCLGFSSLEDFKDKMNPMHKREVFSYGGIL